MKIASLPRVARFCALTFTLLVTSLTRADLLINEVDADQTGTDTAEFVELYNDDSAAVSLDGKVLVFYNGSNDQSYLAIDLDGLSVPANGFLTIGNSGVAGVARTFANNILQNGADAVALYVGNAADFPNGTLASTDALIDAFVYESNDADDPGLLALLLPGQLQVDESAGMNPTIVSMARIPDGAGGARSTTGYVLQSPTPGVSNVVSESLTLTVLPTTFAENAGAAAATATLTRSGPTTQPVTVTIVNLDPTELSAPATVTIPAGQASVTFAVDAVDDLSADGSQQAVLEAQSPGLLRGSVSITVTDNGDPAGLVMNEFHATGIGDANQDGINATRGFDEFIELVNVSTAPFDLSGLRVLDLAGIADPLQVRHTFPAGTVLGPGCAIVVFGGGTVTEGITTAFGNTWVQKANGANQFGLGLNDTGDVISIRNSANVEVAGAVYGGAASESSTTSLSLNPELTGTTFAPHTAVPGSNGTLFSPGTLVSGTAFCPASQALTVLISPATVAENAGPGAAQLTVTRPGPLTASLTVSLTSSDLTEAITVPLFLTIAAGQASATVPISAVDDSAQDGDQSVTFTATGSGFLSGIAALTVTDDGDLPLTTLFINELDADTPAVDDAGSFIELYDGGLGNRSLDGFLLVLFNGATDLSYRTIDLSGQRTNAQGFFVVGNAGGANVNLTIAGDFLQNGADAVALYRAPVTDFPNGTTATSTNLVDAIVYGSGAADATLISLLTPDKPQASEGTLQSATALARRPDATTPFDPAAFVIQDPTPGTSNLSGPTASGYDQWAAAYPGLGTRTDDLDNDGLTNILEYALGGNPLVGDASVLPQVSVGPTGNLRLTVTKGSLASADPKVSYVVEGSSTLAAGSWSPTGVTVVTDNATSLIAEYSASARIGFLRLRVTLAP